MSNLLLSSLECQGDLSSSSKHYETEEDIQEKVNTTRVLWCFLTFRSRARTSCVLWHPESYQIYPLHMQGFYLFV